VRKSTFVAFRNKHPLLPQILYACMCLLIVRPFDVAASAVQATKSAKNTALDVSLSSKKRRLSQSSAAAPERIVSTTATTAISSAKATATDSSAIATSSGTATL
jgi:hypothetical protein